MSTAKAKTNPHLYALIAGEASGDTLGAGLMKAILRHDPQAKFIGIGGVKMQKCGLVSAFDMSELSVMGLFEVLRHLVPILKIRSKLTKLLLKARPCVVIGIDSPDFNLAVERKLKKAGIKTVHYVSPSVWAWREGRMKTIKASCDEVLALLPFEQEFYAKHDMPCTYVGHTLANTIALENDQSLARERIGLYKHCVEPIEGKVLAILPGSRRSVIERMLPIYAQTAHLLRSKISDLTFISVAPSKKIALLIKDVWLACAPDLSINVFVGNSQDVIASADVCLLSSGTVAFEAMLLKRPLVVGYKVSAVSAAIMRRLLKVDMFSLPNLLAGKPIVKELIQENCTPEALSEECINLLTSDNLLMKQEFLHLHKKIRTNADELAAKAVLRIVATIDEKDFAESTSDPYELMEQAGIVQQLEELDSAQELTSELAPRILNADESEVSGETKVSKSSKKSTESKSKVKTAKKISSKKAAPKTVSDTSLDIDVEAEPSFSDSSESFTTTSEESNETKRKPRKNTRKTTKREVASESTKSEETDTDTKVTKEIAAKKRKTTRKSTKVTTETESMPAKASKTTKVHSEPELNLADLSSAMEVTEQGSKKRKQEPSVQTPSVKLDNEAANKHSLLQGKLKLSMFGKKDRE